MKAVEGKISTRVIDNYMYRSLLASMVVSMVDDLTMRSGRINMLGMNGSISKKLRKFTLEKLRSEAIRDLQTFKSWPVFQIAMAAGMDLPNGEQIRRLIEKKPKDIKRYLKDVGI